MTEPKDPELLSEREERKGEGGRGEEGRRGRRSVFSQTLRASPPFDPVLWLLFFFSLFYGALRACSRPDDSPLRGCFPRQPPPTSKASGVAG